MLFFSKNENQCLQTMRDVAKEEFENNLHHYETIKTISRACSSKCKCSLQEVAYHSLPELKLRRVFRVTHFVDTNVLEERTQVLLSKKELIQLPDDSQNIFKKLNIDRYIDRPNPLFSS